MLLPQKNSHLIYSTNQMTDFYETQKWADMGFNDYVYDEGA